MTKKILILFLPIITVFSIILFGCGRIEPVAEEAAEAEEVESEEEARVEVKLQAQEGEVTFTTEDDIKINGNIFGSGNRWVILSHMYPTDQTSWFDFARYLADNGYIVLTYDFRGYGKLGGSQDISNIDKDLEAALDFVKQYDAEKIFLMGASMGGTASLVVASRQTVDGVISFSSPIEVGSLSAIDKVGNIDAPKLFIANRGDGNTAESANTLFDASPEPKEIEILDGSAHGTFIFEKEPDNADIVKQIVLDFLNSN
ncbi:MAG: alpha/beta hydrolase [Actinobacteria bacterium]|nr:alpha/beta hydrolase [Actinomycetota bacterium]